MSDRIIRWTQRATRRLDQVGKYIEKDSPDAAGRVVARILAATDTLAKHPSLGRPGRIKSTRELVFADIPYIVAYRVSATSIEILTVMQAAQKWPDKL